jgi:hypothetical protein
MNGHCGIGPWAATAVGWLSFAFRLLGGRCPSDQTPDSQTSKTVLDVIFIHSISPAPVLCLFLIF